MNNNDFNFNTNGNAAPAADYSTDKKAFSVVGFALFAAFALQIGLSFLQPWLLEKCLPELRNNPYVYWATYVVVMYVISFPAAFLLLKLAPRFEGTGPRPNNRLTLPALLLFFVLTYPMTYLGNSVGTFINSIIAAFTGRVSAVDVNELIGRGPLWLSFLMVVVLAPIMEELLFRRALMDAMRPWGDLAAILVSGLSFGLFHANLQQFCYAALIGMLFGYVYAKTGRIRYTIILHVAVNLFSGFIPSLILSKGLDLDKIMSMAERLEMIAEPEELNALAAELIPMVPGMLLLCTQLLLNFGFVIAGTVLFFTFRRKITFTRGSRALERSAIGDTVFLAPGIILFIFSTIAFMIYAVVVG